MKHGIEDLKCYSDMVSKALSADPIVLSTDPGDGLCSGCLEVR
jgi:hypothetical protein